MDNMGEMFLAAFLQGIGIAAKGLWEAMLANPWLFALVGFLLIGGLVLQLAPRRRRRRSR